MSTCMCRCVLYMYLRLYVLFDIRRTLCTYMNIRMSVDSLCRDEPSM